MAQSSSFRYGEDSTYVDIYGQDIRVLVCEKTGQILVPINELKNKGFRIYNKTQFNKLFIDDSQYNHEFNMFLLQCAQTYMLKNKIAFKENEILESINNVKRRLTEGATGLAQSSTSPTNHFMNNHRVERGSGEDISVTRDVKQEPPKVLRSPRGFENSVDSDQSKNRRNHLSENEPAPEQSNKRGEVNGFEPRKPRSSFIQNLQKREFADDDEKIATAELTRPIHKVIVSFIEKPGMIWVQDMENNDTLLAISEKTQKEAPKQKVVTNCEYGKMYLAQEDDQWYRCKPIRFRPAMTVFFLDYGNTAEFHTSALKEVSEELAAIPAQAIKVSFDENKYTPETFDILTVKVNKKVGKATFSVDVVKVEKALESPSEEPLEISPKTIKITVPTYFDKPRPLCALQNGQRVMIVGEVGGKMALRTKECYDKLKQIEQAIDGTTQKNIEKIEKKQLVLCNKSGKLYRGQVVVVQGVVVEIELLDYCEKIKVHASEIYHSTDALSLEPTTYLTSPPVKGFEELSEKGRGYVKQLIEDKAKATVILNGAGFDLQLIDDLLSNKLKSLEKRSDKVMLSDLKTWELPLGPGTYTVGAFENTDNLTLSSDDALAEYSEYIFFAEVDDEKPYEPILGEVCLGLYQGAWSRCVVTKVTTSRFHVRFIDFGNEEILNSEMLRKIIEGADRAPIVGVACCLVGLPPLRNIEKILGEHMADLASHDFNVRKFNADTKKYEVEAPKLYEKIRNEN